jgi:predicted CXXCH cytochrome family protein
MRKNTLAVLILALVASAAVAFRASGRSPKPFPHAKHLEAGLECANCHAAAESENLKSSLLPTIEVCQGCHEESDLKEWGWSKIPARKSGFRNFSHQAHLAQDVTCGSCHSTVADRTEMGAEGGMPAAGAAGGEGASAHPGEESAPMHTAGHPLCMGCHDGAKQDNRCETCHSSLREGRLNGMERDPSIMKPMDHHPGFLHDHPFAVRLQGNQCRDCHRQEDYCSTCHQGDNVVSMTHERNWLYTHPLAARKNLHDCTSCHEMNTFCTECHQDRGIQPGNHLAPNWISGLHAEVARRDIENCASCHDAENAFVCATCHHDTGGRGDQPNRNIHPSDFRDQAGHGYWHDDENAACFECHDQGARQPGVGFCGYCHGAK